ncbi:response regulator transcription factor [Psychrosphaera sp. B3R10]|uniref:response regulator transcription factor n=1 Tax=unclassified Psychrosphaera TaxID=2641570 RepID=UPI001C0A1C5E|nr:MULTISPECIES: response regulator transcription factor [unclassified Psychrosphaera]MBU2883606.1 response regulator transcription factor [Psychrosphaera sp. I2R16]MBU2989784.1 response regulator transcription factor [Psychrosphaera sp. B3R10]
MTDSVLIVEDDFDIADLIRVNLLELGIHTEHESDGSKALAKALNEPFSLLLLDVMLPSLSGLDICKQVRHEKPEQAIIMLTAKNSEMDRVLGLELGADDYMTKPFSVRELQARVRSQLRKVNILNQRYGMSPLTSDVADSYQVGSLLINGQLHRATIDQTVLELTATEFDLLKHFAKHPDQVFSRAQLLEAVWGYGHSGYEHTVNSHINRLRAKLEQNPTNAEIIQTVWGVGYKLNAQNTKSSMFDSNTNTNNNNNATQSTTSKLKGTH